MRNLACSRPTPDDLLMVNQQVEEELWQASIPLVPAPVPSRAEVPASVHGELKVGWYTFTFVRGWVYWMVSCNPELNVAQARAVDSMPYDGARSHYSGDAGSLGDVVRVNGFAGGHEPLYWEHTKTVGHWHVDTQDGLTQFVKVLKEKF